MGRSNQARACLCVVLVVFVFIPNGSVWGQSVSEATLTGQVIDAETEEPLVGVNVFLAGTTQGAATNDEGHYTMEGVAPGRYELVASIVGYQSKTVRLEVSENLTQTSVDFRLRGTTYELEEVEVAGERPRRWHDHVERFREQLLGTSPNAVASRILNPYVLDFEEQGGVLTATAQAPLVIENQRLGYQLTFLLDHFSWDPANERLRYEGYPFFEELEPSDAQEVSVWQKHRDETFQGSLQHLLWALVRDRTFREGFFLQREDLLGGGTPVSARELVEPTALPHVYKFQFNRRLFVLHQDDGDGLRAAFGEQGSDRRISSLEMNALSGQVHDDGTVFPPDLLTVSGHMATERLADRLPREFVGQRTSNGGRADRRREAEHPRVDLAFLDRRTIPETGLPQEAAVHPTETEAMQPIVAAMKAGQWSRALMQLDTLLQQDSDHLEARYYRAIAHREEAMFRTQDGGEHARQGIDDIEFILARDSTYRDVLYQYALYSRFPDRVSYIDALELGHTQVRLRPDVPRHQYHLFRLYRRFLNHTRKYRALIWMQNHPSDMATYFTGEARRRDGRFIEADEIFADLLQDSSRVLPRQPVLLARARIYYAMDRPRVAETFVQRTIESIERPLHAAFVFEDVKYIISDEELATYRSIEAPEEYVAFFKALWTRRDPTPGRSYNVRLAEHYRRLLYAEKHYSYDGPRPWLKQLEGGDVWEVPAVYRLNGEFNDKGLIYLRHGAPDERITTVHESVTTNTSWRYRKEGMDVHFVIDEGHDDSSWHLTPVLSNCHMLKDRRHWGGYYAQLAPPEHADPGTCDTTDAGMAGPQHVAASRMRAVQGLTTDQQARDGQLMTLPYAAAAFRGEGGQTSLLLHYVLPADQIAEAVQADTVDVEVGLALHDTTWTVRFKQASRFRVPLRGDLTTAPVRSMRVSVPPDSYRVALHGRLPGASLQGTQRFDKRLPDFTTPKLALSDVLLGYEHTQAVVNPSGLSDLQFKINPFRRFALDQQMHVYAEVYHLTYGAQGRTDYTVEYALMPQAEEGRLHHPRPAGGEQTALVRTTHRRGTTKAPIECTEIDVSGVEPGRYTLVVTVTDEHAGQTATRSVPVELYRRGI